MLLRVIIAAGAGLLITASCAYAGNVAVIGQSGFYNQGFTQQVGRNNTSLTFQNGYVNSATAAQFGHRNAAGVAQSGVYNGASVYQFGPRTTMP